MLELQEVAVGYGKKVVLQGVSGAFEKGVTALLGANGSGKSTLFSALSTERTPQSGHMMWHGEPLSRKNLQRYRREIGYLPQHLGYYKGYRLLDFVEYCLWLRDFDNKKMRAAALDALALVGLGHQVNDKMGSLSGGMVRRAGIAQAIAGAPQMVLLDEPSVGLDPDQREVMRETLIAAGQQGTVIVSTHLLEDVVAVCENIWAIGDGTLQYAGATDALETSAEVKKEPSRADILHARIKELSAKGA